MIGYLARTAAYWAVVTILALAATWAASLLPIPDPTGAWAACTVAGCFTILAATTWLPYPCQRKDSCR